MSLESTLQLSLPSSFPFSMELEDPFKTSAIQEIKDDFPELQPIKKIESLELFNFKSFGDHQFIGPFLDFTSIIGPNGSGKSNIIEAICFVLGISLKNLRSSNYKDLINKKFLEKLNPGKKNKNTLNSTTICSVTITFITEDNHSLKLKRTIDINFVSHYFISDGEIEDSYYTRFLLYNNIISYTHSFLLLQGETDNIISLSPLEMSNFFEIMSGSVQYKKSYEELKKKIDDIQEEIKNNTMNINQLKNERKKLRQQRQYSDEYKKLMEELDELELQYNGLNFLKLDLIIEEICKEFRERKKNLEDKKNDQEKERIKNQKLALGFKKKKDLIKKLEETLNKKKIELNQNRTNLTRISEEINYNSRLIEGKELSYKKMEEEINSKKNQIDKLLIEETNINEEIQKNEKMLINDIDNETTTKLKKNYSEYLECQKLANQKLQPLKQELHKLRNNETSIKSKIEEIKRNYSINERNLEQIKLRLDENNTIINSKKNSIQDLDTTIKSLQQIFNKSLETYNKQMSDKERLSVLREKKESLLLEAEFLINSIKETNQTSELFSEFKSIKGFREDLASLITPLRPEFDLPLRIALGPALNYLVVDTTEDAKLMNVILREKGIQKDVLILENIKNKNSKINDSLIGNYGVVAEHSISYRRDIMNLDKALSYLLNGKVLCDNMKNAENIKNLFNKKKIENPKEIITYDGIVFRKGTVSCLGDKKKEGKKFGRNVNNFEVEIRKEKEKEIEKIRQEILKNEIELKKIKENNNENEIKKMELKIQENISKKQIFIEEIEGLDDSRKKNEKVLKLLSDQNKKFNNETIKLEKQLETVNKDIEKTNENINNEEGIIYKALCKKLNVSNISEFKSKDYEEIEKINERLIILKKQLENIQNQIKKYNKNNGNDILNSLSKSISDEKNNLASQKENFKKYEDLSNKLNKEIDNIILELNEKNNDISKEQTEELDAFSFLKELETNLTTKERELRELQSSIQNYLNKKLQLYEELQIKSSIIPLIDSPSQYEESLTQLSDYIWQEIEKTRSQKKYKIHLNYDKMCLEEIIAELSVDENGLNIKNIEEKINSIENTMKTKQEKAEEFNSNLAQNSLNNQSDAKLEKYEDKIKEIIRKQDKLVEEEKELTEGFEEKKKMRLKLFMDFFEEIKRNIEEIYKQLTKSDKEFDLGGSVLLYLENNSEPFNGGVVYSPTPPHKRYVFDTEQLSGGEKTIGGLALLFAVNMAVNSKFMIFDESDTFLDFENSQRMVEFLKEVSKSRKMQIILVSHKSNVFENSDSLVGVTFCDKYESSQGFSLDLREK